MKPLIQTAAEGTCLISHAAVLRRMLEDQILKELDSIATFLTKDTKQVFDLKQIENAIHNVLNKIHRTA
jgi:hypothetical protein